MEPSERFREEFEWCVNQVLIGLLYNPVTPEQLAESAVVLRRLTADGPLVSKRQRMRETFGDYRKAMKQTSLARTRELVLAKDWRRLCQEMHINYSVPGA